MSLPQVAFARSLAVEGRTLKALRSLEDSFEEVEVELPALTEKPWPGELGQRIYDHVSEQAWQMWEERMKMILNEYRLMPFQKEAQDLVARHMEEFFFGEGASLPPGPVTPSVTLRNHGTAREACTARFVVGSVYGETVNLPAGLPLGAVLMTEEVASALGLSDRMARNLLAAGVKDAWHALANVSRRARAHKLTLPGMKKPLPGLFLK